MPKKLIPKKIDIKKLVMSKIKENQIVMKPRWYFVAGSILAILGLVGLGLLAIFLLNLTMFMLREHGPNGQYRLEQILNSMPIWIPFLSLISLSLGLYFLKIYDFSYKKNFRSIALAIIASIFLIAFILDYTKINRRWTNKGSVRRLYQQQYKNTNPEVWRGRGDQNNEKIQYRKMVE